MENEQGVPTPPGPAGLTTARALAACAGLRGRPGCFVGSSIPEAVVDRALLGFLELEPGETLVALIGRGPKRPAAAVTTTRFRWHGRGGWTDPLATRVHAKAVRSIPLAELPREPRIKGWPNWGLELGDAGRVPMPDDVETREALIEALGRLAVGANAGEAATSAEDVPEDEVEAVERASEGVRARQADLAGYRSALACGVRRAWVTPLIALVCVGVAIAVEVGATVELAPGVAFKELRLRASNFGPFVAVDGQVWRLLTNVFLHVNWMHLGMNVLCLMAVGPLVERLYGNLGFAALFLLSGFGGSLASLARRPYGFSMGASGAIFGLFGALGAFLLVHRRAVPAVVRKPMRGATLGFVGLNLAIGAMVPMVDNLAHVGGLVTGFVAGLLLMRPWPPDPFAGQGARRVAGAALASLVLAVPTGVLLTVIRADPKALGQSLESISLTDVYNAWMARVRPLLEEFDAIQRARLEVSQGLESSAEGPEIEGLLARHAALVERARTNRARMREVATPPGEVGAVHAAIEGVLDGHVDLLERSDALLRAAGEPPPEVVAEWEASGRRLERRLGEMTSVRQEFLTSHGLKTLPAASAGR